MVSIKINRKLPKICFSQCRSFFKQKKENQFFFTEKKRPRGVWSKTRFFLIFFFHFSPPHQSHRLSQMFTASRRFLEYKSLVLFFWFVFKKRVLYAFFGELFLKELRVFSQKSQKALFPHKQTFEKVVQPLTLFLFSAK